MINIINFHVAASILVSPKPVTTLDGNLVLFTCTATGDNIGFLVDGESANTNSVAEIGFIQSSIKVSDSELQRNLTAEASVKNNNTSITCRALSYGTFAVDTSSPVKLLVQGMMCEYMLCKPMSCWLKSTINCNS